MLNKVTLPGTFLLGAVEKHRYSLQLMVPWEYLFIRSLPCILVLIRNNLDIVFQNLRELTLRQYVFPKVIRLDPIRIWRITCAILETFVEWHEI